MHSRFFLVKDQSICVASSQKDKELYEEIIVRGYSIAMYSTWIDKKRV